MTEGRQNVGVRKLVWKNLLHNFCVHCASPLYSVGDRHYCSDHMCRFHILDSRLRYLVGGMQPNKKHQHKS